ncbi:3-hydroxy-3-methylglutaryl-CoA reductase [Candidatus Peregrinibacteria bacterium]|nr:3-hydroxy-3-methylglutaryl-CoA reductase [Candidatus Peregrinibacteria bacterium]MBI3816840.1 3-hydroxy-3-methylglutaryl-CoA reductase [Candidatus Peregrinibacteria bacterium]
MDLRSLPPGLSPTDRCNERRSRIERELDIDLSRTRFLDEDLGAADEKNCEQMFGAVPIPVGYAGPLAVTFSSNEKHNIHLPLATTEGALVASVNRGCKAVSASGGVKTSSEHRGISRSIALRVESGPAARLPARQGQAGKVDSVKTRSAEWIAIAERTSKHLKVMNFEIDERDDYVFLTVSADTDEAMGMNMITIAAQSVGEWIAETIGGCSFVTVAANVESDKKPSLRTYERGRGYEVFAEATIPEEILGSILKSSSVDLLEVARAKLELGSEIAGAIGSNLHAANVIAALYLATGQDAAHVVEGSLADTSVSQVENGLKITVRLPAILVGVRGGGTGLPAQNQCLSMLLGCHGEPCRTIHPCRHVAESCGAAVLAGELSLLAALASHSLAKAHEKLGRSC